MRSPSEAIQYIRNVFAPESPAIIYAREMLEATFPKLAPISIGAEEGKLLQLFIRLAGVKKIVEIGSLCGYSALWMAEALPADGVLHTIEKSPEHAALIRQTTAHDSRIFLHEGDAKTVLSSLSAQAPFDMVFIDADKSAYPFYLEWAEKNLRSGGLIIGDNTLLFGHVWSDTPPQGDRTPSKSAWQAMRQFNQQLADSDRFESVLIPTAEGLTVAIKR